MEYQGYICSYLDDLLSSLTEADSSLMSLGQSDPSLRGDEPWKERVHSYGSIKKE